jgi:pimeloyl-ACP methyl ester carboxylesterase
MGTFVNEPMMLDGCSERALVFGRHETMVGILSAPTHPASRIPVVILSAGIIHKVGPSRALVSLARALARAGHPTLRFDLSGIGDSPRAPEASLQAAVTADIRDAITEVLKATGTAADGGVALIGFCSGADNALFIGADDVRVRGLVLFDPTVHETAGFRQREALRRLGSARAWWNALSGRSLRLRLQSKAEAVSPPDYYGLLVQAPAETDRRVTAMSARGIPRLWVLSEGAQRYCNAAVQVRESLPSGWREELDTVAWAPHLDHLLSRRGQVSWFVETVTRWLAATTVP